MKRMTDNCEQLYHQHLLIGEDRLRVSLNEIGLGGLEKIYEVFYAVYSGH